MYHQSTVTTFEPNNITNGVLQNLSYPENFKIEVPSSLNFEPNCVLVNDDSSWKSSNLEDSYFLVIFK